MTEQKYAISEYHDVDEVYKKLNNLISQPMRHVKREKMQEFLGYFDTQCKRSVQSLARSILIDSVRRVQATAFEEHCTQ